MSRFAFCTAVALLFVLACVPHAAAAQAGSFGPGTAVGGTIQAIGTNEGASELLAVGLHVTTVRRSGFAADFGLATSPQLLLLGYVWFAPDAGVARVIPLGGGALMIKGGPSAVINGGPYGSGVVWGAHIGAVAFLRLSNRCGIRAEIVPHFYRDANERTGPLTMFGIGLTSLPARRR
jgi:hypothetical protein